MPRFVGANFVTQGCLIQQKQ